MKKLLSIGFLMVLAGCIFQKPVNPDPNHTHADFAVWLGGKQLDFSAPELMSEAPTNAAILVDKPKYEPASGHVNQPEYAPVDPRLADIPARPFEGNLEDMKPLHGGGEGGHHPYLHLHDGVGYVIHRHKPALTLEDFFLSLASERNPVGFHRNVSAGINYFTFCTCTQPKELECPCAPAEVRLFVNGEEVEDGPSYVFNDGDQLLITDTTDETELKRELDQLTDDACLYSQTCPWRGKPPVENCIADPEVPCVAPLD